ncbi:hypothetical protein VCHA53O466_140012 [Vibrio chagasii]|nr:hypothetical protein VCHA53O466_140012 [Vibrio chagasii]
MDYERLEVLLEENNLDLNTIIITSQELTEKIEAEWNGLGNMMDAELHINDAFHTLCSPTFEDIEISVVSLAYNLAKWTLNANGNIEETLELLKHDERFEEAIDWLYEFIGNDLADSLRLYIKVSMQID